jgi:hypothetical protein
MGLFARRRQLSEIVPAVFLDFLAEAFHDAALGLKSAQKKLDIAPRERTAIGPADPGILEVRARARQG